MCLTGLVSRAHCRGGSDEGKASTPGEADAASPATKVVSFGSKLQQTQENSKGKQEVDSGPGMEH